MKTTVGKTAPLGLGCAALLSLAMLTACPPPPPADAVFVAGAPPAAQVEVIGTAPGPDFVWIGGYHRWEGGRYLWTPGRWERRPHARAAWIGGRWVHHSKGWYWREGHWK